jgi:hypothetical protein
LSSILRALKKIQNETAASPVIQAGPGMSSSAKARGNAILYKGIIAVMTLMGIALGASWVIKTTLKDLKENSTSIHELPELNTPSHPGLVLRNSMPENSARSPAIAESKEEMSVLLQPSPKLTDQPLMHDNGSTNQINSAKPSEDQAFEVVQKPGMNATSRLISPDKKTVGQQTSSNYSEIDQSAGLDLQAISWASGAHHRLAVINGTLCRENESVNGYTIKQINPDDVIVSNGAVTGKLVLKIR